MSDTPHEPSFVDDDLPYAPIRHSWRDSLGMSTRAAVSAIGSPCKSSDEPLGRGADDRVTGLTLVLPA